MKPLADKFSRRSAHQTGGASAGGDGRSPAAIPGGAAARPLRHWKGSQLNSVAFSADGDSLVTGVPLDQIVLWNTKTGLGQFYEHVHVHYLRGGRPLGKHLSAVPNGRPAGVRASRCSRLAGAARRSQLRHLSGSGTTR